MDEAERLKEFLLEIHMNEGRVCIDFDRCKHLACASNYKTWSMADAAMRGLTIAEFRAEDTKFVLDKEALQADEESAITIKCFKCGGYYVIPRPGPGELAICKKCKAYDVVVIDTDRTPDGRINNCALACDYEESMCQMCGQGPCPEAVKFRSR